MADGRLPSVTARPPQTAVQPNSRSAAQRAFFEAALGRAAPAAPAAPPRTAVEPHVTPLKTTVVQGAAAPEPGQRYRPGTLLDIKI
jgi:hypothetical protein